MVPHPAVSWALRESKSKAQVAWQKRGVGQAGGGVMSSLMAATPGKDLSAAPRVWRSLLVSTLALLAFALSSSAYVLATGRIETDYFAHAVRARQFLQTGHWPPHFLYFLLVGL